jgi:4-amino-4-deoxy-L-arabinose transferase-like glycosyltransferase
MPDQAQATLRSRLVYAYLAVLTLATTLLVGGSQSISTSLDADSGNYLFTAGSILNGAGITAPSGEALTIFPPGYPLLLAAIASVGISVATAATLINLLAIASMIPGTYLLARMSLGQLIPVISATIFASSAATIRVFSNAWTEPLFMVLMLATLILLVHTTKRNSLSWPVAITLGTLISLATTLRFVGLFMIPVVAVSIWMATKTKLEISKIIATTALGLIGFAAVALRNISLGAPLTGERLEGALTLQGSLEQFVRQLGIYVAPPDSTSLTNVAGALLLMALIASAWLIFVRRLRNLYPIALFFLVFWTGIMWSQAATRIDVDPERLGSPAFATVIILGLYALASMAQTVNDQLSVRVNRPQQVFGQLIFGIVIILVITLNTINSLRLIN